MSPTPSLLMFTNAWAARLLTSTCAQGVFAVRVLNMALDLVLKEESDSIKTSASLTRTGFDNLPSRPKQPLAPGEPGMEKWLDFESRPLTHLGTPFQIGKK